MEDDIPEVILLVPRKIRRILQWGGPGPRGYVVRLWVNSHGKNEMGWRHGRTLCACIAPIFRLSFAYLEAFGRTSGDLGAISGCFDSRCFRYT